MEEFELIQVPPNKSVLTLNSDQAFQVHLPIDRPNWWWRMWQYLFFGIKWGKE